MSHRAESLDLDAVRRDPYYRRFRAVVQAIGRDVYQNLLDRQPAKPCAGAVMPTEARAVEDIADAA